MTRYHTSIATHISTVFTQEGNNTKMTKELSCKMSSPPSLLCWNSEIGLCVFVADLTDVGGGLTWNIMNKMLCEAGEV